MSALPTLSAESTRQDLMRVYLDCSDYDQVESLSRAALYIRAGRMLLARPVVRTAAGGRGGEEVELDPRIMLEQINAATAWYAHRKHVAADELRQFTPGDDFRD